MTQRYTYSILVAIMLFFALMMTFSHCSLSSDRVIEPNSKKADPTSDVHSAENSKKPPENGVSNRGEIVKIPKDVGPETPTDSLEAPLRSDTDSNGNDASNSPSSVQSSDTWTIKDAPSTTSLPESDYAFYVNMEHEFAFNYPKTWNKEEKTPEKVLFTGEKIVDLKTTNKSDRFEVTVMFIEASDSGPFEEWIKGFPVGDEKVELKNGKTLFFIAKDTEGPLSRTYYKALGEYGVLQLEFFFEPALTLPLENEKEFKKFTDYEQQSRAFVSEIYDEFVKLADDATTTQIED